MCLGPSPGRAVVQVRSGSTEGEERLLQLSLIRLSHKLSSSVLLLPLRLEARYYMQWDYMQWYCMQ